MNGGVDRVLVPEPGLRMEWIAVLGGRRGVGADGELRLGDRPGIGVDGVLVPDPGLVLARVMDGAVCDGNDGTRPLFAGFLGF